MDAAADQQAAVRGRLRARAAPISTTAISRDVTPSFDRETIQARRSTRSPIRRTARCFGAFDRRLPGLRRRHAGRPHLDAPTSPARTRSKPASTSRHAAAGRTGPQLVHRRPDDDLQQRRAAVGDAAHPAAIPTTATARSAAVRPGSLDVQARHASPAACATTISSAT